MPLGSTAELAVPARAGGDTGPERDSRVAWDTRRPPFARILGLAVVALTLGVAAARFVTSGGSAPTPSPTAAAAAPGDRVAALRSRVDAQPEDLLAWQQLGVAYTQDAIRTGDPSLYNAAEAAFDRADVLEAGAADTLVGRGVLALTLHQFADALTYGEQAHAANPADPDALAVIVDALVETGRYDEAANRLQAMLDLRPGLAAFSRVSYLRELHGDIAGARDALSQAETAGSGSAFDLATVIALEGDLELSHGDVAAARRAYQRALDLSPDVILARVGVARVLVAEGDLDAAIDALDDLTAIYPLPGAVALLGDLQTITGDDAGATRSYDLVRTIATLQQASGAVTDLEMALFDADHAGGGAVDLALSAYAARPTVYGADAVAWALRQAGRAPEAVAYADEALRLGTRDALLFFHAACVFADAGDAARAADALATALSINPWFSPLHRAEAEALAGRLGVTLPDEWKVAS